MAHNLDTTAGQTSFVSAREDAWHSLGTTLDHAFTAEEAMTHGLLGGWNTRKAPIVAKVALDLGAGESVTRELEMPGRFAVVRDNPVTHAPEVLGNVGAAYKVIQNEAHADLLNALVDESGAHFETAGAIDGGRKVFITMRLPGHIKVGGVDRVDNYIAAVNSHDGSSAFTLMVTPVRIVCQNTLNLAFQGAAHQFRVRHTSGADRVLVQQARDTLDMTFNYLDGFQAEAEQLINTTLTQARFEELIYKEFGASKDAPAATQTRTDNKLAEMVGLFAEAGTQDGIRDTAWAGLNAITEWADHFSHTRNDEAGTNRATKAVLDPAFKNRALALMSGVR